MLFFIINPAAGHGRSVRVMDRLCTYLNAQDVQYDTVFSMRPGHTVKLARDAAAKGHEAVIAVGGDGTVRETLEGIQGFDCALGVIPAGTGNDFIKSLGIPKDPLAALKVILKGERRVIDAGRINKRMFINVANLGFDAEVADTARRIPVLRGLMAYLAATIITLLRLRRRKVTIEHEDGTVSRHDILLIAVCNGRFYGGGYQVAPPAKLDDGMFDVVLAEKFSRLRVFFLLPRYIRGTHLEKKTKGLSHCRCKRITIRASAPVPANADGEISYEDTLVFVLQEASVTILAPPKNE